MSLRAVIESTIHIEHFRNIDLFNQGFYGIRIRLFHTSGESKIYSYPIEITLSDTAEKKRELQRDKPKTPC